MALIPANFKGLNDITTSFENNLYKYMYGETANYEKAKKLLQDAKSKGFDTAFLIAFKDGKSITIKDAIK
jgi:N-acetylmuramoyl-L-alanine amidase